MATGASGGLVYESSVGKADANSVNAFISNPDFVRDDIPLRLVKRDFFYQGGAGVYIDYFKVSSAS